MENSTLILLLAIATGCLAGAILIPARREVAQILSVVALVFALLVTIVILVR